MPDHADRSLERASRRWLISYGMPCWLWPGGSGAAERYGLLLQSGARVAVGPWPDPGISFDDMARTRCAYLLAVDPKATGGPSPKALMTLRDMEILGNPLSKHSLGTVSVRKPEEMLLLEGRPAHPGLRFLLGSLRLLFVGDPEAKPPPLHHASTASGVRVKNVK